MEGRGPVVLELYPNLDEYRAQRGLQWSRGSVECREHETVISVPLEDASGTMTEGPHPPSVPVHEMVHAMICQRLGARGMLSVPSWFHEGLAQLHAHRGFDGIGGRVFNRLVVWVKREDRLSPERLCYGKPSSSSAEAAYIYDVSWEFIRYLGVRDGVADLNGVVEDVGDGMGFGDRQPAEQVRRGVRRPLRQMAGGLVALLGCVGRVDRYLLVGMGRQWQDVEIYASPNLHLFSILVTAGWGSSFLLSSPRVGQVRGPVEQSDHARAVYEG